MCPIHVSNFSLYKYQVRFSYYDYIVTNFIMCCIKYSVFHSNICGLWIRLTVLKEFNSWYCSPNKYYICFRLTLFQLLMIGLFLLLPVIGSGPFWSDFVGPYLQNCRERWWTNLFYIQNFWASEDAVRHIF